MGHPEMQGGKPEVYLEVGKTLHIDRETFLTADKPSDLSRDFSRVAKAHRWRAEKGIELIHREPFKLSLQARLLLAVSQSAKKQILTQYQAKPNFPKTEEEQTAMFAKFDSLMPPGIPEGKAKIYSFYLAKQLFALNPPGWIMDEDEDRVKATLVAFESAIKERRLQGAEANIDSYETLRDAMDAATVEKEEKGRTLFTLANLPEKTTGETKGHEGSWDQWPGTPRADVEKGSKVIAEVGPWKAYFIKQADPNGPAAGSWLGLNKWWNVGWCVGRDRMWNTVDYMKRGNFFFLVKNDKPVYAISSQAGHDATLWNRADEPTDLTRGGQDAGSKYPSLEATAASMGLTFDLTSLSTLPQDIIPILQAIIEAEPSMKALIKEGQLKQMDTSTIDQIIAKTATADLVKDLNASASGYRNEGTIKAILARCVSRQNRKGLKDFSAVWDQFSESLMIKYIEALAAGGHTALPPSLEAYFVKEAESFEF